MDSFDSQFHSVALAPCVCIRQSVKDAGDSVTHGARNARFFDEYRIRCSGSKYIGPLDRQGLTDGLDSIACCASMKVTIALVVVELRLGKKAAALHRISLVRRSSSTSCSNSMSRDCSSLIMPARRPVSTSLLSTHVCNSLVGTADFGSDRANRFSLGCIFVFVIKDNPHGSIANLERILLIR